MKYYKITMLSGKEYVTIKKYGNIPDIMSHKSIPCKPCSMFRVINMPKTREEYNAMTEIVYEYSRSSNLILDDYSSINIITRNIEGVNKIEIRYD